MVKGQGREGDAVAMARVKTATELLADILDVLRADRTTDAPADPTEPRDYPITAAAGDLYIDLDVQFGFVYIPNLPRDATIYAGTRGALIGAFKAGAFVSFRIARQTGLTISYASGAAVGYITVMISARPLEVSSGDYFNSDIFSVVKAEDSVHTSGDKGIFVLGVRNDGASALAAAGDYHPLKIGAAGALATSVLTNTTFNSDGTAGSSLYGSMDSPAGSTRGLLVGPQLWNGATADRQRTQSGWKTVSVTAAGSTAGWTPAAGKKFRLMAFRVQVTANATLAGAAVLTVALLDSAADMLLTNSVYIPAAATAVTNILESGWIDLGNGFLSAVANNVLNVSLSAALTAGVVRLIFAGTEE